MENGNERVNVKTADGKKWYYGVLEMADGFVISVIDDKTGKIQEALDSGNAVLRY